MPTIPSLVMTGSLVACSALLSIGCQQGSSINQASLEQPVHPFANGVPTGSTRGTIDLPVIEVEEGRVAWTTFEPTIIDTNTFPRPSLGQVGFEIAEKQCIFLIGTSSSYIDLLVGQPPWFSAISARCCAANLFLHTLHLNKTRLFMTL